MLHAVTRKLYDMGFYTQPAMLQVAPLWAFIRFKERVRKSMGSKGPCREEAILHVQ